MAAEIRLSRPSKAFYGGAGVWAGIAGGGIAISVGQFVVAVVLFVVGLGIILLLVTGRYLGKRLYTGGDLVFLIAPVVIVVMAGLGALYLFPHALFLVLYLGVYLGLILLAVTAQLATNPEEGSSD